MPKLTLIGLYFWLYVAQKVVSGDDLYHKVGGELVLKPDKTTVPDPITSIIWKHGKDKAAEWDNAFGGLDIYGAFKGRTTLDQTTGELRISGLKNRDVGVYSVELNGKLLAKTYKLSVIKTVPKPTIAYTCNSNKTCTLTCEGDTTDAEPVTYSWKEGGRAWEVLDKQIHVSKSDTGKSTNSYKYTCKLKNSVSEEVSEPVGEVFSPKAFPKPTITYTCIPDKPSCTLTCEGDTTDSEPVTYSWKVGGRAWEDGEKQLIVFKSDTGKSTNSYKYVCKMKNSVSGEVSEPVGEVFGPEPSEVNVGGIVVGVVVVLVAFIIVWLVWKKIKGYPQDTWIDFLSKVFCGLCVKGRAGVQPEQVKGNADKAEKGQGNEDYVKVGGELVLTPDKSTVPDSITSILWKHGVYYVADLDTDLGGLEIYGAFKGRATLDQTTGELRISGLKETDSGVYSVEFNRKLLDKTYKISVIRGDEKTKTDGSAAAVGKDESKTDGSAAAVGEDETKTDGSAAAVGKDETKTDDSAAPVGEDESKTDGSAAPVGEDESKTDGSAAPVGEDETKMNGSAAPVGDLNAAEKGEANGEMSVLLNEDRVKYHNDNGEGREEENSVL